MRVLVSCAIALAIARHPASADDAYAEAKRLLAEGRRDFDARDYTDALDRFERAYASYPDPGLLLNIGTTLQQLGRTADAANAYQHYLDDPGGDNVRATEVRQRLAMLDTQIGRLEVRVVAGAEIQIRDGGWQHAGAVRLAPGSYVVRARLGTATTERAGRIAAGEQQTIELALVEPVARVRPREPANGTNGTNGANGGGANGAHDTTRTIRTRTIEAPRFSFVDYGGAATAALALAGSVAFTLTSRSQFAAARTECHGDPACPTGDITHARSLAAEARGDRIWAISLGTAAVATGVATWLVHRHRTRARTTVGIAPHAVTVALEGSL
jgi:hypothetical protein